MKEAEGINFKTGIFGENQSPKRIKQSFGPRYDNPNLSDMLLFVSRLEINEDDKKILEGVLKKMPHGSLGSFRKNYMNYLKRNT